MSRLDDRIAAATEALTHLDNALKASCRAFQAIPSTERQVIEHARDAVERALGDLMVKRVREGRK